MTLAITYTRASVGINAPQVTVEAHLSNGLPRFSIVGLAETTVKESKERVRSALLNCQFQFPSRRITVNLAPADLPKQGGQFDLAIAIAILGASGQLPIEELHQYEFIGELALSGELRGVNGVLAAALAISKTQREFILPYDNAEEASLPPNIKLLPASHLLEVYSHLTQQEQIPAYRRPQRHVVINYPDLADIHGQPQAKRALEIAAAGGHNLLLVGPPGTGKTLLANRLPGLLPPMTTQQSLETATLCSLTRQGFNPDHWQQRPFRSPHHTASSAALVGGGSPPMPGEISLAHHGVLFLDELPEFHRAVLDCLREPLESGRISIARAAHQAEFPANCQLIAAMNPCPCGYLTDKEQHCRCSELQIKRYQQRLSGPLLDRIDIHLSVPRLENKILLQNQNRTAETSTTVRQRVALAYDIQIKRAGKLNRELQNKELDQYCAVSAKDKQFLEQALSRLKLSLRAWHRILRIARTIADIEQTEQITQSHLGEALSLRRRVLQH